MSEEERTWLRLSSIEGFGTKAIRYAVQQLASIGRPLSAIFEMDELEYATTFPKLGNGKLHQAKQSSLLNALSGPENELLDALIEAGIAILPFTSDKYPSQLRSALGDAAPALLFVSGETDILELPGIAVVGSRNASPEQCQYAEKVAASLADNGHCIVSGYAQGIDMAAHRGALSVKGKTIAVMASGLLLIPENSSSRGLLYLSHFHPTARFSPRRAMQRNATVVGLSKALLVVADNQDDPSRGNGTRQAATVARELGIPVFISQLVTDKVRNHYERILGARSFEDVRDLVIEQTR